MTHWIIKNLRNFLTQDCLGFPVSVGAYAYLVLSLQASARSSITENMMSALTAQ